MSDNHHSVRISLEFNVCYCFNFSLFKQNNNNDTKVEEATTIKKKINNQLLNINEEEFYFDGPSKSAEIANTNRLMHDINLRMNRLIKNKKFAIGEEDIKRAEDIAVLMVEKYKMAKDSKDIIFDAQESLKLEFSQNIEKINRLKDIMLKNEVITLDDLQ